MVPEIQYKHFKMKICENLPNYPFSQILSHMVIRSEHQITSANILAMAIWGPTDKFYSHQYFWLYSTINKRMRLSLSVVMKYAPIR